MEVEEKVLTEEDKKIIFYCKNCEEITEKPDKLRTKYVYICKQCKTKQVAFGTKHSIYAFYHLGGEGGGEALIPDGINNNNKDNKDITVDIKNKK